MTLKVENLRFEYGTHLVLNGIQFKEDRGSLVAILGKNGSGKTTLLKNINRILKPRTGNVLIDEKAVDRMTRPEIARHFAYVPQRSDAVHCTVFEAVLLGRKARADGESDAADIKKVRDILELLNLDHLAMRPTTQLSGGELQKVIIARAVAQEPNVLLLDEPINHLDPVNQIEVMSLLHAVTRDFNITTLIVTHDLNNALRFADRFILLKDGSIVAHGGREIITPEAIKNVFHIDVIIQNVFGVPVIIPLVKEVRPHKHYLVHEHQHDGSKHSHKHLHSHSHKVDDHIYDHEHSGANGIHNHPEQRMEQHNHKHNKRQTHEQ